MEEEGKSGDMEGKAADEGDVPEPAPTGSHWRVILLDGRAE